MGAYCVGCSTTPFKGNAGCRSTSAPTMIRSIASHQWQANLRILEVKEIKTVPYVPLPHPFVERLIGTLRLSARLDGDLTVGTYIRRQWLRDFQKTLDRCDIRSNSARLPRNHSVFLRRHSAAPINSLFTATSCGPELRHSSLSKRDYRQNCHPYNNSPDTALDRCVIRSTWANFQLNHLVFAFLVAARFADPIVSLPPYQFASDRWRKSINRCELPTPTRSRSSGPPRPIRSLRKSSDDVNVFPGRHTSSVLKMLVCSIGHTHSQVV